MSRGQDANNDLPPIVREALAALRSVPEPGPEDWASHRVVVGGAQCWDRSSHLEQRRLQPCRS